MSNISEVQKLASQQRHMDIMEGLIFQLADQLKTMRKEHEDIMSEIVRDNRA